MPWLSPSLTLTGAQLGHSLPSLTLTGAQPEAHHEHVAQL